MRKITVFSESLVGWGADIKEGTRVGRKATHQSDQVGSFQSDEKHSN